MSTPGDDERRIAGRYRLSARLGSGAMGTVWSGYDDVLQRRVAVKELKVPPGVPGHEALSMRERMLREARALGGLSHPNVVTVFDVVDVGGEPLVVLELLPGRNLASMIAEHGRLSRDQAAVVGFTTAGALRAAHRAEITHRDVKPGNVLVGDDGRVKLTDFGIARNSADAPMTTAGLVLGSPAYIAPEVAAGQAVTPAADLWGLGATLFAALEGRPPYDVRGDPVSTITEVVDGEVPRPHAAGPVADVIAGLMVKQPHRRMSLREVRNRLRPLLADPEDPRYPASPDVPTVSTTIPRRGPADDPATASGGVQAGDAPPGDARPSDASAASAPASGLASSGQASPAPLAADPGPLPVPSRPSVSSPPLLDAPPFDPPRAGSGFPQPPVTRAAPPRPAMPSAAPVALTRTGGAGTPTWWALPLVLAGAVIVLLGAAVGWTAVRVLAGQSPLSTVTVTTERAPLVEHRDPLGFSIGVPQTWTPYRSETGAGSTIVRFVSPDGTEELAVQRRSSAAEVLAGLTASRLGVDTVVVDPVQPVPGAATGTQQVSYRTAEGSLRRTSRLRIVPDGDGVWTVRLTEPSGRAEGTAVALFDTLAAGFAPTRG